MSITPQGFTNDPTPREAFFQRMSALDWDGAVGEILEHPSLAEALPFETIANLLVLHPQAEERVSLVLERWPSETWTRSTDPSSRSPVMTTVALGLSVLVKQALARLTVEEVQQERYFGNTLLMQALESMVSGTSAKRLEMIALLLPISDTSIFNGAGKDALSLSLKIHDNHEVFSWLLAATPPARRDDLLRKALINKHLDALDQLENAGFGRLEEVSPLSAEGTLLHSMAAFPGGRTDPETMNRLIERAMKIPGLDLDQRDPDGHTALMSAVYVSNDAMALALLERTADVNAHRFERCTLLGMAGQMDPSTGWTDQTFRLIDAIACRDEPEVVRDWIQGSGIQSLHLVGDALVQRLPQWQVQEETRLLNTVVPHEGEMIQAQRGPRL